MTERLIHVILISEKPTPKWEGTVKANVAACVTLAFPEQLKEVDPISGHITLRDGFACQFLTYDGIGFKDSKTREEFKSWVYGIEKGVHDLPRRPELYKVIGTPGWGQIYVDRVLELVFQKEYPKTYPEVASSAAYSRKWNVIEGGKTLGKVLVIGVYSAAQPEGSAAPSATPTLPEAPSVKKYCHSCGAEMHVEAVYCPQCGRRQIEGEKKSIRQP